MFCSMEQLRNVAYISCTKEDVVGAETIEFYHFAGPL